MGEAEEASACNTFRGLNVLGTKEVTIGKVLSLSSMTVKLSDFFDFIVCLRGVTSGGIMKARSSKHKR